MAVGLADGTVGVAIVEDGAVVAGEDDEGFLREPGLLERVKESADCGVELLDGVAAGAALAGMEEAAVGRARHVNVVRAVVELSLIHI